MKKSKKIFVTGVAGFIGYHLSARLTKEGYTVIGLDSINDYYDQNLKYSRLENLGINRADIKKNKLIDGKGGFSFIKLNLEERALMFNIFEEQKFDVVVNLAAQAGVRHSIKDPYSYLDSNLSGFLNILEGCRHTDVGHLVYASSSSVYGANKKMPFSTSDNVDHPLSLYAASKKSNELLAHSYSNLYDIPTTGLRFFTVYGPWGRPDMALFIFTKAILEDRPIDVYNFGDMKRDFTYIDDIIEGIVRVIKMPPEGNEEWDSLNPDPSGSYCPYTIYNIGNNNPVLLMDFIEAIEQGLGKEAQKNLLPMQPGDVKASYADVADLMEDTGFKPETSIQDGVEAFLDWYMEYYNISN